MENKKMNMPYGDNMNMKPVANMPLYQHHHGGGYGYGCGFLIIVVLFILLIIIGATSFHCKDECDDESSSSSCH
jgi:uncharacterized protein (TIGR01732 family)